ncbi:hypothetical protein J5X98_21925 [Leptothermofonsia sichuanensis E412]|uniref:hypothetical protein n=1 Tax=Leptothermofonsia sichuanensis TaxID=2917832 RepID=UPI001CA761CE|nr:hypothetical protein [Leptothermofonsia sichuanensis]QZZ19926.1 hypothetical protein J5X98_21925 [Leptothermofonsia sichuanensis E412]
MAIPLIPDHLAKALKYLMSKQRQNGGFCAYKMEYLEEPNSRDTFFAVASFQLLEAAIPDRDRVYVSDGSGRICPDALSLTGY